MLNQKQAKYQLYCCALTQSLADGKIKRRTLKEQATTTEQNVIMCQSQWRLYGFITDMYNDLRKKNVGICKNTGKKFGELMQHFVFGLDEACIMAYSDGNIRIIGADDRKIHEKILTDR